MVDRLLGSEHGSRLGEKFSALDRDDLEVVSAHLQDAIVKVADVIWRPQEKRLAWADLLKLEAWADELGVRRGPSL